MEPSSEMAVFVEVVRQGGFSAAARTLNRTPSAVSKQISRLEDRLGVRFLNRTTRQLAMTEEGEAYYHRATAILADISEAEAMASDRGATPRGLLRVTCTNTFGRQKIVPILPEFLARHPDLRLQLSLTDTVVDLVQEGFDVAIRMGEMNDSSLMTRRLALDRRVVCAAPSYIEEHGLPDHPDQLVDHSCLILKNAVAMNDWAFLYDGAIHKVHVDGRFESNSGVAIHAAALAGLGVAQIGSSIVAPDLASGALVSCLDDFVVNQRPINAVYPHKRHLSQKTRAFIDFIVNKFDMAGL